MFFCPCNVRKNRKDCSRDFISAYDLFWSLINHSPCLALALTAMYEKCTAWKFLLQLLLHNSIKHMKNVKKILHLIWCWGIEAYVSNKFWNGRILAKNYERLELIMQIRILCIHIFIIAALFGSLCSPIRFAALTSAPILSSIWGCSMKQQFTIMEIEFFDHQQNTSIQSGETEQFGSAEEPLSDLCCLLTARA